MIRVIPAAAEHAGAVAAVEKQCFSDAWSEGSVLSSIDTPETFACFVAVTDTDEVVGWICASVVLSEAEIGSVAVGPDYRRQGIAASLLEAALNEAHLRGAATVYLEVREHNEPAQALYRRFGFEQIGRRRRYYRNPAEDAIVMRLAVE